MGNLPRLGEGRGQRTEVRGERRLLILLSFVRLSRAANPVLLLRVTMDPSDASKLHWTAEQYSHTLIATPSTARPAAANVQNFLSAMVDQHVVPGKPSLTLRVPTGEIREYPYPDPFTGENFKVEINDHRKLISANKIEEAIGGLDNYELEIAGTGRPKIAPLAIDYDGDYFVTITCIVSSKPRSTSDLHESKGGKPTAVPYRRYCVEAPECGYFSNPYTMEVIKIPRAGCAGFWIEFELGKFLFPQIAGDSLNLLNPLIVAKATNSFGFDFVQGFHWG